jgi:DNA-binding transcriptional ArsR family regulator
MPDSEGHPNIQELCLTSIFHALADPNRRHVIRTLLNEEDGTEMYCTSFGLSLSKAARSHHFKVLREAGLIRQVNRGNSRMAQLRRKDIEMKFPNLLNIVKLSKEI